MYLLTAINQLFPSNTNNSDTFLWFYVLSSYTNNFQTDLFNGLIGPLGILPFWLRLNLMLYNQDNDWLYQSFLVNHISSFSLVRLWTTRCLCFRCRSQTGHSHALTEIWQSSSVIINSQTENVAGRVVEVNRVGGWRHTRKRRPREF